MIRRYGAAFQARYGGRLSAAQQRVLRALAACRTATLGGHVQECQACGQERIAYNSCRNRHCPKCQATARARWLEREASYLLPVEYHHVVFTLPSELSALALANPRQVYGLLFQAARQTLLEVAADPHWLGAQPGVLMVLHTWGQNLHHHPHVHAVVTGGGLSCDVNGRLEASPRWRACRPGFLLPVRVLSRVFRGKFLAGLGRCLAQEPWRWPTKLAHLAEPAQFQRWLTPLYQKDWVVYAKAPFGGPAQVLKYLARYTHRVAISNARLLKIADGQVTFRYKDYADQHRAKTMTLSAEEFLRRFVQHVLPKGFVKIRHYGLLANRQRATHLQTARRLLAVTVLAESARGLCQPAETPTPVCPQCGGALVRGRRILPVSPTRPLAPLACDTS